MDWVALFAQILAAVGALWIGINKNKEHKLVRPIAIFIAIASIISLVNNFHSAKNESKFQKNITLKTEETLKQLTGGNGHAVVKLFNDGRTDGQVQLVIFNKSDLPLYDLNFLILSEQIQQSLQAKDIPENQALLKSMVRIGSVNLGPELAFVTDTLVPVVNNEVSLGINVTARNGYWFQELRAKRINGRWSQAYRVRNKKDEILIEKIDDDYPRDSKGESIW